MISPRGRGWLPDPDKGPGERQDLDAREVLRAVRMPYSASVQEHTLILDQGSKGTCAANAVAQTVRVSHRRQGVLEPEFLSRLAVYFFSRAHHGTTHEDSGTFLRTCYSALAKVGFCPERLWSYDDGPDKFRKMPSFEAMHAAHDQRSPTVYRRIGSYGGARIDEIKQALAAGYAIAFGTEVSESFCANDDVIAPLRPPPAPTGFGHAMTIVGYEGQVFTIANSWGTDWGDHGYCRFTDEYLAWPATRDLWLVEHAPVYSEVRP